MWISWWAVVYVKVFTLHGLLGMVLSSMQAIISVTILLFWEDIAIH